MNEQFSNYIVCHDQNKLLSNDMMFSFYYIGSGLNQD
jgi:hypothetical protein